MSPPPCVVDRWAGGSLTRRPKGPFAVSWPRQLGEYNVITITITALGPKNKFLNKGSYNAFVSNQQSLLSSFSITIVDSPNSDTHNTR